MYPREAFWGLYNKKNWILQASLYFADNIIFLGYTMNES